jgi:hypothetical protein
MKSASTLFKCCLLVASVTYSVLASTQARPFPGPDVQQIYQRLLPQIEKIPAFDHHAHPGFAEDPDVDAMAAPPNASEALRTRDDNPELAAPPRRYSAIPITTCRPITRNGCCRRRLRCENRIQALLISMRFSTR